MIEDQIHRADRAPLAASGLELPGRRGVSAAAARRPPLLPAHGSRSGRIPVLGQAQSVVLLARQPVDIDGTRPAYERFLTRLAMAVNGRFPPWKGLTIGLNALVLTPEPIAPGDDDMLREALGIKLRRMRVVPLGLYRINLGQEAMALAMHTDPSGAFTEGGLLAELLCERFRRFVPLIEM